MDIASLSALRGQFLHHLIEQTPEEIFPRIAADAADFLAVMHQHECGSESRPVNVRQVIGHWIVNVHAADRRALALGCLGVDRADFLEPDLAPVTVLLLEHDQFGAAFTRLRGGGAKQGGEQGD